jgi:hypothetical protein
MTGAGLLLMALHLAQSEEGGIPKLIASLSREATSFTGCASKVFTEETLVHRVRKDNGKWKDSTVLSNYSFASPREKSTAVREIRLIQSVNGRSARKSDSLDLIAMSVASGSDADRRKMIEQLEKHGVQGVATDLGQLLLLFAEGSVGNYEFSMQGLRPADDGTNYLAFSFRQIDGPESMTVFRPGKVEKPKLAGELWVHPEQFRLYRVTLNSVIPGDGAKVNETLQEMTVDYKWFEPLGCLLPAAAEHKEYVANEVQVENKYRYKPYSAFGIAAGKK